MGRFSFRVLPLSKQHERDAFDSGTVALDRYFREQVTQDIRRRIASCFVALTETDEVAGYYTLASAGMLLNELPEDVIRKLPRYPSVPAVRMGRLAVDQRFKGQGLGGALLADALERTIRSEIAAYALLVDAKDEAAAAFYRHHGFIAFPASPLMLFLPLATARKLLG